jgi:hypothetical protein
MQPLCPQYLRSRRNFVHRSERRQVPCVDGSGLARTFFTSQTWSVRPCVRPVCAVRMTAGHNALRGSGPGQKPAFEMHWHWWVVLIAGSTGSALRAVRPPKVHITPDVRRDLVTPLTRPDSCTARPGPSWPTPFGRVCSRVRFAATLVGWGEDRMFVFVLQMLVGCHLFLITRRFQSFQALSKIVS